ncbi:LysR family transcriptional regulator [Williamsia sterculiae]|uniref:DNA-binding transcriptional regulator, LysR family n=1 Tax=Williamsia sterculiae TaxID=1344003 RepID=A0A1N7F5M7_9NOCA|nr:LysR family transcriptional regulator [Williamsia sterculiae]SIR95624.1 DNA-binding transcriptional regulator, LysR family [Williamsia sterculiae]
MVLPARLPELSALDVLATVATAGSMSAAARTLNLSQQAVSSRVHAVERELGITVFRRSPVGVVPTDEGALILQWTEDVLRSAHDFASGLSSLRDRRSSAVSVATSMTVAEYLIPGWLVTLQAADPELRIHVRPMNSADVVDAVRIGDADVGFVEGPGPDGDLESTVIGTDDLVLVVPPGHPWATDEPVDAVTIAATRMVQREPGSGTAQVYRDALARLDLRPAEPLLQLRSVSAIRTAVISSGAPGVVSRLSVADDLRRGTLIEVTVAALDLSRSLRAVWPRHTGLRGAARILVEHAQHEQLGMPDR